MHRALSGFFGPKKARDRPFSTGGFGSWAPEPQSIAQVISGTPGDGQLLSESTSASSLKQEHDDPSHPPEPQTLKDEGPAHPDENRNHTRHTSSASAPLPPPKSGRAVAQIRSASESTPHPTYRDPAISTQALEQRLHSATQELISLRLALEQTKADLLRTTKEKHALKQHVHRQDEENQQLKDQLRDGKRETQSLRSELEAQSASVTDAKEASTKMKEDLELANKTRKRFHDALKDVNSLLEKTRSELTAKSTQVEELTTKGNELSESLRTTRVSNESLKTRLQDAQSQLVPLTKQKDDAEEEMVKYRTFAKALYKEFKPERERNESSAAHITKLKSLLETETTALAKEHAQLVSLRNEQETWQGRMDTMIHKVFTSERCVRMMNHAHVVQAPKGPHIMGDGSGTGIKRGSNKTPDSPSAEIIEAVKTLNEAILEAATDFTPLFFSPESTAWSGNLNRAKVVLGEWVTSLLSKEKLWNRPSVLQTVIQIFLVDWCRAIIEAWYPKQQSFAELFMTGLVSQKMLPSNDFNDVIKFQAIQITSSSPSSPDIGEWATHILNDLLQIIPAPNTMKPSHHTNTLLPKILHLTQLSYDIRQALAEEDICGNLQLLVPPSDIQFQPDSMNRMTVNAVDGIVNLELKKKAPSDFGDVAGCTGIGLQRMSVQKSDVGVSSICCATVLPPDVILVRDLSMGAGTLDVAKNKLDFNEKMRAPMSPGSALNSVEDEEDLRKGMEAMMRSLSSVER